MIRDLLTRVAGALSGEEQKQVEEHVAMGNARLSLPPSGLTGPWNDAHPASTYGL
jgi:hypothetical protein